MKTAFQLAKQAVSAYLNNFFDVCSEEEKENHNVFYHGSQNEKITVNSEENLKDVLSNWFNGIFLAFDKDDAESHSPTVHRFLLDCRKIASLTVLEDDYWEVAKATVKEELNLKQDDEVLLVLDYVFENNRVFLQANKEEDNWWKEDKEPSEIEKLKNIFKEEDLGYIDWQIQGLAGKIAKKAGFSGVYLHDEHGTSILLVEDGLKSLETIELEKMGL